MAITRNTVKGPEESAASTDAQTPLEPTYGRGVRLAFHCPGCEQLCRVRWEDLGKGFQCPKCHRKFAINRSGDLEAFHGVREVRFECPRCKHVGVLQANAAGRVTECTACQLPLFAGPKQQLYDAEELAEAKRHAKEVAAEMRAAARANRVRIFPILMVAATAIVILAGIAFWLLRPPTAEPAAIDFTQQCLSGTWDNLPSFLMSGEGQREALKQWLQAEVFPIQDEYRPRGDIVELSTEILVDDEDRQMLQMRIASPHLGRQRHQQVWRQDQEGTWKFDAIATCASR